jgi:aerobic C4-dicarboxylate transport protein
MTIDQPIAQPIAVPRRRPWYRSLYGMVIIALIAGVLVGHFFPDFGASLKPLGDAFIKLVKMIISPVIFCTVVVGIAGMSDLERVGKVGGKALAYFLVVSSFALVVGLVVANVVRPGAGLNIDPATLDPAAISEYQGKAKDQTLVDFLLAIIPDTFVGAFSSGLVLQTLFVAILTGVALALLGPAGERIVDGFRLANKAVFKIVHIAMLAAPIGVFGAMAFTIGKYGVATLWSLGSLIATFYLTSALFIGLVLGVIARLSGFSLWKLIRYIRSELLLVLGTSSSEAAMPMLIEKLERAGASKSVVGLVVPTGYSFNLDGTNIYMTMAALFIAQATNTDLTITDQILLLLVAMVSSKGAAGVTGAGFVTLAATLSVVPGIPVVGMALILGVDRFMSECRSITNFIGNAVATLVVAGWEKQLDREQLSRVLDAGSAPADDLGI